MTKASKNHVDSSRSGAIMRKKIITYYKDNSFYIILFTLALIGVFSAFFIPPLIPGLTQDGNSIVSVRQAILAVFAGALTMLTLWETHRKNSHEKDKNERDHIRQVHAERRSRYAKAIEQLGDEKAAVRLGGIYTLISLVDEWLLDKDISMKEGQVIINNLCAYIRSPFSLADNKDLLEKKNPKNSEIKKYSGDFILDRTRLREEQDIRRAIISEIATRCNISYSVDNDGHTTKHPGLWSSFVYNFSYATFFYPVYLHRVFFEKTTDFEGATFKDYTTFENSLFGGVTSFSNTTFEDFSDFSSTAFKQPVFFERSTFNNDSTFSNSTFLNSIEFNHTKFGEIIKFSGTTFSDFAIFKSTEFTNADLSDITFNDFADFNSAIFKGSAYFDSSTFKNDVLFASTEFSKINFYSVIFEKTVDFDHAIFSGPTKFSESTFLGPAKFINSIFDGSANFKDTTFEFEAPQFIEILNNVVNSCSYFSYTEDPENYIFEVASRSIYPIETVQLTASDGRIFTIPKGCTLVEFKDSTKPSDS